VAYAPDQNGTIIEQEGFSTIGIWLMPDNKLPGILEDFISFLVPDDDTLWKRAKKCLEHISPDERRFSSESKALVHTWLAWQEEPGTPLGQAIRARYLDAKAPYAKKLVDWLNRLFP
jgi:hypothetical protein